MRRRGNEMKRRATKVEEENSETPRLGGRGAARALKAAVTPGKLLGGKAWMGLWNGHSVWQTE